MRRAGAALRRTVGAAGAAARSRTTRRIAFAAALLAVCTAASASTVGNGRLAFTFDDGGRLSHVANLATGQEYLHGPGRLPLRVLCRTGGSLVEAALRCQGARSGIRGANRTLTLRYAGDGVQATVVVSVPEGSEKSAWTVDVMNVGDRPVAEVVFPALEGVRIGSDGADDWLVRPNRYGQRIPNPAQNLFRDTGEIVDGLLYHASLNTPAVIYPGSAGMFWMDLYDATGGLYLASEDKLLRAGYLTATETSGIGLSLGKYVHLERGQRLRLPYAVGVHTGDWHWGADRYREWASTFMHRPEVPRWAREMPNWYWRSMIWSMGAQRPPLTTSFHWTDLDGALLDGALALRGGTVGLAGQEFMGHDFAFWWPDPSLGGEGALRERMARVRRRGGHVVPYINPIYTWEGFPAVPHADDPVFRERLAQLPVSGAGTQPVWERFRDQVARRYDGTYNDVEQHYFGNLPQMCLLSRPWQDYVLEWTHRYAVGYGFSGVQWDQFGAYPGQYCTDWRHGHRESGVGAAGILEMSRRIFGDPRFSAGRDFYIWYEGASDVAAQYLHNGHSGFDMWMAYSFPEMIQYTFPDRSFSGDYVPSPGFRGEAAVRQQRSVELSFLGRYKLGCGGGDYALKLAAVASVTNELKGIYWYALYRGDRGCAAPPAMWTRVLEVDPKLCPYVGRRTYVITYADMRRDRAACTLRLDGALYRLGGLTRAYWYPGEMQGLRREVPLRRLGNGDVEVRLPACPPVSLFNRQQAYCEADGTVSTIGAVVLSAETLRPLRVVAPESVRRGEEVVLRSVEAVADGPVAAAECRPGEGGAQGMVQVEASDGRPTTTSAAGRPCWEISLPDSPYLYLDVREPAVHGVETQIEATVEYLDEGTGTFRLQYNSCDPYAMPYQFGALWPLFKGSAVVFKQGTGQWRTATVALPGARLVHGMAGPADIRIDAMGGTHHIARISFAAQRLRYVPVPHVTLTVGSDRRQTDARGELRYRFAPADPLGAYVLDARREGPTGYLPAGGVIRLDDH